MYSQEIEKDKLSVFESPYKYLKTPEEHIHSYLSYLCTILTKLDQKVIAQVIKLFFQAREEGRTIFFIGNKGSAATASHFAKDLLIRKKSKIFRIISLTGNSTVMTAITNDFGFENVFVKQLESLYRRGDILVAISASGDSLNVLKAIDYVKQLRGITIGLTGFDGGELQKKTDYCIHVPTNKGEYGPVEDIHLIITHIIANYLT